MAGAGVAVGAGLLQETIIMATRTELSIIFILSSMSFII
jgi:hypothetical protein